MTLADFEKLFISTVPSSFSQKQAETGWMADTHHWLWIKVVTFRNSTGQYAPVTETSQNLSATLAEYEVVLPWHKT